MSKTAKTAKQQMKDVITSAIKKAIELGELPQGDAPDFIIETPADKSHGDLATNAAMVSAKAFRMPPFKIAQAITNNIDLENTLFSKFETAGPGFINFFLSLTQKLLQKSLFINFRNILCNINSKSIKTMKHKPQNHSTYFCFKMSIKICIYISKC